MNLLKWQKRALYSAGAILLFILFIYIFFPINTINSAIFNSLASQKLSISPDAKKGFFPSIIWKNPLISSEAGVIFKSDEISIAPDFLSIFSSPALKLSASVASAPITLLYHPFGESLASVSIDKISLDQIPFFATVLSAKSGGRLWSEGFLKREKTGFAGELKIEIKDLSLSGVKLGSFPLPDVEKLKAQGMIKFASSKGRIESFTIEGDGIYMRLSGSIPSDMNQPLDMTLEIMPKAEFLEKQKLVFMLMAKFMTSPGVYKIPLRGNLLKPVVI